LGLAIAKRALATHIPTALTIERRLAASRVGMEPSNSAQLHGRAPRMIGAFMNARLGRSLQIEATALEDALGFEAAVIQVREQILSAPRPQRRRLYRLHDETARRHWGG
jgi:hypothetical protein